jgi:hypothetical protein
MIFFLSEEKIRKKKKAPTLFFPDFEFSGEKNLSGFISSALRKLSENYAIRISHDKSGFS